MRAPTVRGDGPSHAIPADPQVEKAAWCRSAGELADWALASVVVRRDCYGSYRCIRAADGLQVKAYTNHDALTRGRLIRHFSGEAPEDRVGVHVVSPGDELCKVTIVDIDAHGPEDCPEANWVFARVVADRALSRGVEVRVLDSNGSGGFHVWCLHTQATCAESHRFGKWLVHDWARHGLRKEPESLPKSPALSGKRFGQFIRLPGRYHKRVHWTAVWDGMTDDRGVGFLRGAAAVEAILRTGGGRSAPSSSPLVPAEFILPSGRPTSVIHDRRIDPDELDRDAALARDALTCLGKEYYDVYDQWVQVGMALRQLGDVGLGLWHEWSSRSGRYHAMELDEKWKTFDSATESRLAHFGNRPYLIGLGSLFAWATEEGWERPHQRGHVTQRC